MSHIGNILCTTLYSLNIQTISLIYVTSWSLWVPGFIISTVSNPFSIYTERKFLKPLLDIPYPSPLNIFY